jgi:hypothetical protein
MLHDLPCGGVLADRAAVSVGEVELTVRDGEAVRKLMRRR